MIDETKAFLHPEEEIEHGVYIDRRPRRSDGSLEIFCAFCGVADSERPLARGPAASICADCALAAVEMLRREAK